MGTRCRVNVMEGNSILVSIYRQFDGYPSGMGVDLANFLTGLTLVNGISGDRSNIANGMGCLAALLVKHLKDEAGNVYIRDTGPESQGEEYVYTIYERGETTKRGLIERGQVCLRVNAGQVTMFGCPGDAESEMVTLSDGLACHFSATECEDAENAAVKNATKRLGAVARSLNRLRVNRLRRRGFATGEGCLSLLPRNPAQCWSQPMQNRIFSTDSPKAVKADSFGYLNAIHYMAPSDLSGVNLCPHASPACKALCLGWTSGQAGIVKKLESRRAQGNKTRQSRLDKARRFMRDRAAYMVDIVSSIEMELRQASRLGKKLCVRMNGSTDIAWEGVACIRNGIRFRSVFAAFPDVQFVDYTKNPTRFDRYLPKNLHLTFSRSETNEALAVALLCRGVNVAVVFAGPRPDRWHGFKTIDGDSHDLRHLDPRGKLGFVVALSPKGRKAKKDKTGFVVQQNGV